MNKGRITRIERTISQRRTSIDIPIFLSVVEGDIIITDSLLIQLGENPENFKKYVGEPLELFSEGRRVPKDADFIDRITGEDYAKECYLFFKKQKDKQIILI